MATGIIVGGDGTLRAQIFSSSGPFTVLPDGATASWSTSHPEIATVTQDSVNPLQANIHGVAAGTASISCAVVNSAPAGGSTVTGSLDEPVSTPPPPAVASVTVVQVG